MNIWVIYRKPKDYPEHYVARLWYLDVATPTVLLAATLDELRAKLPAGLVRMPRHGGDDSAIVETWL